MHFFLTHANRCTGIQREAPTRSKPAPCWAASFPLAWHSPSQWALPPRLRRGLSALAPPLPQHILSQRSALLLLTPALIPCYSLPVAMTFRARALSNSLGYEKRVTNALHFQSYAVVSSQATALRSPSYNTLFIWLFLWKGVPNRILGQLETQSVFPFLLPVTRWLCPWSKADPATMQQDR